MLSLVRIPPGRKRSVAQWVEHMFNPVISPYYVPTAIAAYFFSWDDSGKIRRLLVKTIAEDGDMQEIYKEYLFEKHILVSENNVEERLNKCLNLYLSELNYSYRNIISNIDKKSVIKELNKW